jgi:hypothetical protein
MRTTRYNLHVNSTAATRSSARAGIEAAPARREPARPKSLRALPTPKAVKKAREER